MDTVKLNKSPGFTFIWFADNEISDTLTVYTFTAQVTDTPLSSFAFAVINALPSLQPVTFPS